MNHSPLETMRREMKVRFEPVPREIAGVFFDFDDFAMAAEEFLFTTDLGVRFHYRLGKGLSVEMPDDAAARDEFELFLWGTVFGAVAWLNGFVPLHASAVSDGDRVLAFTADSGGGKSTLAAALAGRGFRHVCDDTLVLSVTPDGIFGLPDPKPLKLWSDALELVGARSEQAILAVPGKHYARTERKEPQALRLTDLVFLERGDEVGLEPVNGSEKLTLLPEALYRVFVHTARGDDALHRKFLLGMAAQVRFWRLCRPFSAPDFAGSADRIAALLHALP